MTMYTVVIVPGDSQDTATRTRMTLRIDTGHPGPRVTGVSVTSEAPEGLTSANFPDIDLAAVVRALASRVFGGGEPSELALFDGGAAAAVPGPSSEGAETSRAEQARSRQGNVVDTSAGRAYRKMPDPDELRANYARIGTVTGLAKYYDVPRHTAQGWIGRLRKLGEATARAAE
ncbi:hypothetical protein [Nocardia sienata]|uniref:hypothetical protein n=1 Tax=Nocardia sienata TaxID=248552 RepID=UPI0007A41DC5|nr:hypothetical protein [Nocardia sienata]